MRPVIGVVPLVDMERDSLWMVPGYMAGITAAGGLPVMLPLTEDVELIKRISEEISGLLLTGGQDVDPEMYGEAKSTACGRVCKARDGMEALLMDEMLALDKPVFGICRGLQFLNAYFGGTLYQDLDVEAPSEIGHHMSPPYDRFVHEVSVVKGTKLCGIIGESVPVNSYHHQGVKKPAKELTPSAYSPDGLVEAAELRSRRFVLAVQWHPEWLFEKDDKSARLFKAFVSAALNSKNEKDWRNRNGGV